MFINIFILGVIGRILIFTIQKYPITQRISNKWEFFSELVSCEFCLGVWVYFILLLIFRVDIFYPYLIYVWGISEFVGGVCLSFLVHLVAIGWRDRFSIIMVGE